MIGLVGRGFEHGLRDDEGYSGPNDGGGDDDGKKG